jgi:NitT/TauT family transport system ATP-binding protein
MPSGNANSLRCSSQSTVTGGTGEELLRFDRVALTYRSDTGRGDVEVIRELNLALRAGEFVAVIGPSGCGKSTLLSLLAGYLMPSSGQVLFRGKPIAGPGRERMMVFQQPALFPWLTTEQNIAYGLRLKANRSNGRDIGQTVGGLLRLVQLDEFARHYPFELSGGMRQRLEIARALAVDPQVLLMDEPLAALDALTRRRMQREVLRIWETTGKTIIFVTHDIDEAVVMADRVVVMGPRPTCIVEIAKIALARPRRREDPEVGSIVQRLSALLE